MDGIYSKVIPMDSLYGSKPILGDDFPAEWLDMLYDLLDLRAAKLQRNKLKQRYYNGKNLLHDLGISIPPQLRNVETIVGWPQKAVDAMATRCIFDGFTANDANTQQILNGIVNRSRLHTKFMQATYSTFIQSCCFAVVSMDENNKARIDLYDAVHAAARWDDAKGRIAYGMVVNHFDDGVPDEITMYTDDAAVHVWRNKNGWWDWESRPYSIGRPTMDAITYRPTFDKPFGQSRINRAVMSITDSAVREALRTEVSAEFFTSPQKYLLGADEDAFKETTRWAAYLGAIIAVGRDENGDIPTFGQLPQGSMQPHNDYMRSLAARFSGETNVPISTLGIIHDQPASAEAIYAASEPLVIECQNFNDGARETLRTLALMCIAGETNTPIEDLGEEYTNFTPDFRNPAMPSVVSQTDAMVKIASVVPGFAGTDVFFEQIGFPEDMRRKVKNEIARQNAQLMVNELFGDSGGE